VAPGAFSTAAEEIHQDREGYNACVLDQQAVKRRGGPAGPEVLVTVTGTLRDPGSSATRGGDGADRRPV
jgi:hypothetical protein